MLGTKICTVNTLFAKYGPLSAVMQNFCADILYHLRRTNLFTLVGASLQLKTSKAKLLYVMDILVNTFVCISRMIRVE